MNSQYPRSFEHYKRGMRIHLVFYVLVNLIQVVVWWVFTPDQFFWPLWSIVGWGIGMASHIWAVYAVSRHVTARN
ncbi:2TM domain-containing protein [Dactylosporangium sp. CA-092794]|uniref:2TM domain-containing protein n=1 Tax=Dactylosporangium sp. CA-092794 TaxID=3239929 RepID=UPI003D9086EC